MCIENGIREKTEPAQHTPGPWKTGEMRLTKTSAMVHTITAGNHHFCAVDGNEAATANARLIAAAPELLAACKAIIEEYDNAIGMMAQAIPSVRQAIEKAEGK